MHRVSTILTIMMSATDNPVFEMIKRVMLQAVPDIWTLYAFGSVTGNTQRPDSDLDLAVLMPPGKRIPDLLSLQAALSTIAGRETDIVDLRQAGWVLCKEVVTNGIELYSANRERTLEWEATVLSEYSEHQFRVRGILDDFKRTGIGYRQ